MEKRISFEERGRTYQERCVQCLFEDHVYAEMMSDVIEIDYFTYVHLQAIARLFFDYRSKYKVFPSVDVVMMQLREEDGGDDPSMMVMAADFVRRMIDTPLNGDKAWIQDDSLDFCKSQSLIKAIGKSLVDIEGRKYDTIASNIREALDKGSPRDHGHEYSEGIEARVIKCVREPISTGWPVLDRYLSGGFERKTITTFIAPTGAGKSMFLVNCACALVEQGFNVLYVTLEMADFKIGLRADSWFSGVAINDVASKQSIVKDAIGARARGRLIIKEWPTKRATVDTIRSHIQRLIQTKNFKPDAIVVDYPDLLKSGRTWGDKRHELESNYEELRGLGQELNAVVIVADQTNRGGLDLELVTIGAIAEAYSKATVCDLILTISRTPEDKMNGTGRLFNAKSRLGSDGQILPFLLNTSNNIRVDVLEIDTDAATMFMKAQGKEGMDNFLRDRLAGFKSKKVDA